MKMICTVMAVCLISCGSYSAAGLFNEGNRAYREEHWKEARILYLRALDKSLSDRMSALIYYNLGNTTVRELSADSPEIANSEGPNPGKADKDYDSVDRWKEALELYCLAQQFYGESFPEAAVNAEWIRRRLKQDAENRHSSDGERKAQKSENRETAGSGKGGTDSAEKTEDGQPGTQNPDAGDSSGSRSDSEKDETRNGDDNSENPTENADHSAFGDRNDGKSPADKTFPDERIPFLSREETARMKAATEFLEQEETLRRQRPSFRRLPSYDDTEKNW